MSDKYAVLLTDEKRVYCIPWDDIYPPDAHDDNNQVVRVFLQSTDQIISGKIIFVSDSQEKCEKHRIREERRLLLDNEYSPAIKKCKLDEMNGIKYESDQSDMIQLDHFKTIRMYERNMNILRQCLKEKENSGGTSEQETLSSREESLKTKEIHSDHDCSQMKKELDTMKEILLKEKERLFQKQKELDEREQDLEGRENNVALREERLTMAEHSLRLKRKALKKEKDLDNEAIELMNEFSEGDSDTNQSNNEALLHVETELAEFDAIQRDLAYFNRSNLPMINNSSPHIHIKWTKDITIPEMEPLIPNCPIRVKYYYLERARKLLSAKEYVKYMLPVLYEEEEMINRNAKGGRNTKNPDAPQREGLDPERLGALIESAKHYFYQDFSSSLIKEADLIKDINIKLCNLRKSRGFQENNSVKS